MKDKQIEKLIKAEEKRQKSVINLIASENYVSNDVLKALGSKLTNKYAEGYPGRRYYGGNEIVDKACFALSEMFERSNNRRFLTDDEVVGVQQPLHKIRKLLAVELRPPPQDPDDLGEYNYIDVARLVGSAFCSNESKGRARP